MKAIAVLSLFVPALLISEAKADGVGAMQTAITGNLGMSEAQCTRHVHQICDNIFGNCKKVQSAALGGRSGIKLLFQCTPLRGRVMVLSITGANTQNGDDGKMSRMVQDAYNQAYRRFN